MEEGLPTLPWTRCPSSSCWGRGRDSRDLSTQPVPPRCECTLLSSVEYNLYTSTIVAWSSIFSDDIDSSNYPMYAELCRWFGDR